MIDVLPGGLVPFTRPKETPAKEKTALRERFSGFQGCPKVDDSQRPPILYLLVICFIKLKKENLLWSGIRKKSSVGEGMAEVDPIS